MRHSPGSWKSPGHRTSEAHTKRHAVKEELTRITREAEREAALAADSDALEQLRVRYLGRKGAVTMALRSVGALPPGERPAAGQLANEAKEAISGLLARRREELCAGAPETPETFDYTLPGRRPPLGRRHPVTRAIEEVAECMMRLGFDWAEGPEIEDEFHNFVALNIPENHPARDPSDNFYIKDDVLLRSQTSTVQIRYMEKHRPPVRVFAPGKVFRPDTVDASHFYIFHQVEGLWVDEGITFSHLKTVLLMFGRMMLGRDLKLRLRPSYFPFTEPSAEIDFSCFMCAGKGCPTCGRKGWLEMGGCGMVDPNVLEHVNIDPEKYTGFAFGIGIDRMVMAKYGIDDIRLIFGNDVRFLRQF
jgi:phenylalanyl-tRNA synthetase alpha chain